MRRGACPELSEPMQTGDGLLARLRPSGTIPLGVFTGLCATARAHGNGIVEVTARGSIQVRGLSAASAKRFAAAIAALGIAATDSVPILTDPLAGIGAHDIINAHALAAELRQRLAGRMPAARLAPKVSVAVDGGGTPGLDAVAADVRLCAVERGFDQAVEVGAGGDGASAVALGCVSAADGAEAAVRLLDILAQRSREARARDILASAGIHGFRQAIADLLLAPACARESGEPAWDRRLPGLAQEAGVLRSSEAIGLHALRDGSLACGVGVAFGAGEASSFERLAEAAAAAGATGVRTAPGRALIAIGMTPESAAPFTAAAERLGFITGPDDARRRVVACPGAPFCAGGQIPARLIAPAIAQAAAPFLDRSFSVHISGCNKGCAHPAPAALTVVGTADAAALVAAGSARQAPFAVVATDELPAAIARYARERKREASRP